MASSTKTVARRRQIAWALLHLRARSAYEGTSIVGIACAAGLTPGVVHHHFRDKEEIVLTAIELLVRHIEIRIDRLLSQVEGPYARLHAVVDAHLSLLLTRRVVHGSLLMAATTPELLPEGTDALSARPDAGRPVAIRESRSLI